MAKGKGQPNTPEKKKRSFWANFFEPIPYDGDDEAEGLLDDDLDGFDVDGEDDDDTPKKKKDKKKKKHRSLWELADEDFEDPEEEPDTEPEPPAKKKKKKRKKGAAAEPDETADAAIDGADEPGDDTLTITPAEPMPPDEEDGADRPAKKPEKIVLFDEEDEPSGGEGFDDAEGVDDEEIHLFDDGEYEEEEKPKKRGSRATIVRTGAGTAARVAINETEELFRAEQAKKSRREREAARKHREYVLKQQQKKRRKRMLQRAAGNIAFGALIVIGVGLAMYYTFLLSDIIVTGNETYSSEYIVEQSGLQLGQHMFTVDLDEAETNIEEDPYLQVDSVTYIFPSRVRIVVSERHEAAGIIGLDYNVIIDENGYVLAMGAGTDISGLLQVTGVNMTGFQLGQRLGESDDFSTATLISMIAKLLEYELMGNIKAIDLTTPLATTMTVSNGLKIHVGQPTDLDTKFESLKENLPTFFKQNVYWGTLFLSAKGGAVWSPREMSDILAETVPIGDDGEGGTTPVTGVDADGDGFEDTTGEPYVSPALPVTTPAPGNVIIGAGGDEFQG